MEIITIPTRPDRYFEGFESDTFTVHGGRLPIGTHVHVWAKGRREYQGPVIDEPFASCIQHATVIDNHGGSGKINAAAPIQLRVGDLVRIQGFPGVWSVQLRDQRRLQGEGVRLVPAGINPDRYGHIAESRDAVEPGHKAARHLAHALALLDGWDDPENHFEDYGSLHADGSANLTWVTHYGATVTVRVES